MRLPPLVITPGISGHDGISRFSRDVVSSVLQMTGQKTVDVWSWAEAGASPPSVPGASVRFAERSYLRISRWLLRELFRTQRGRAVFVLHTHLSPLAAPLVYRGASLVQFLLGVEVFRELTMSERLALQRASCLAAISRHTVDEFLKRNESFRRAELRVCHPGASAPTSQPSGTSDDGFALVVGRMAACERYKGHDLLLEVWPRVLTEVPAAKLVIVGDGDDRPRLERKTSDLGLTPNVRFEGSVDDERLDRLYRESSFFVMPSAREGFGIVFLEAMRCAKACIAGAGAAAEIVLDGETGFVVPPTDAARLADSVIRLFKCATLRTRMGERGRERFESHFTSRRFRDRFETLLAECGVSVA